MSLLLHVNYGSQFLVLSLFDSKEFELISSVSTRHPYLSSQKEREIFFELLKGLEKASKHKLILDGSTPDELNLKKIVESVVASGKFIPDFVARLIHSRKGDDINKYITQNRLIINWDFEKIDFIHGGKKIFIETFGVSWGEISKLRNFEKLIRMFGLDEEKFTNFTRLFPMVDAKNPFEEIFYGLILENITARLDRKIHWRNDVDEIVLTGEVVSLWREHDKLVALIGSSIGYTGRASFIIDSYNLFNSDNIRLIEKTGEIADYFFVPEKLRELKHSLISSDEIETPLIIENSKVMVIDASEKEFLRVERNNKETKISLTGNFLIIDTRDFDYSELLLSPTGSVLNLYKNWGRAMGLNEKNRRISLKTSIDKFVYNKEDFYRLPISKDFKISIKKGAEVNRGEVIGEFEKTHETYFFDLPSNFDVFEKFKSYLKVIDGQLVDKGQTLAEKKSSLVSKGLEMISPVHGKISLGLIEYGILRIDSLVKNKVLNSRVSGTAASIVPGSEIVISTESIEFPAYEIAGKVIEGEIIFDIESKNVEGKILFMREKTFSIFNIRKLLQIGTKGIIFESMEKENWEKIRNFLNETSIDFGVCLLSGFGDVQLSENETKRLRQFEGSFVKFEIEEQTVKFFLHSSGKFSHSAKTGSEILSFNSGTEVILRNLEDWGQSGKLLEVRDEHALVEVGKGRVELVSLDNIE